MVKPQGIIEYLSHMLSKEEYLIPLVAAQYQFPNHYYGLTSAALLEDLFVDAAINFRNREYRDLQMERPEKKSGSAIATDAKGEKGWDYKFDGENYSHKVGSKIQSIALLWDATFQLSDDQTYSYPSPIVFVLSNYRNKNASLWLDASTKMNVSPLSQYRNILLKKDQQIIFGRRLDHNRWEILESIRIPNSDHYVEEYLPLDLAWDKMKRHWSEGCPANSVEIFLSKTAKTNSRDLIFPNTRVSIDFKSLPGIYLFPKESLQHVKVKKNNRAVLLPAETVLELSKQAFISSNFSYCPNWYSYYAEARSVDLYQVQRHEYDQLNSSVRHRTN